MPSPKKKGRGGRPPLPSAAAPASAKKAAPSTVPTTAVTTAESTVSSIEAPELPEHDDERAVPPVSVPPLATTEDLAGGVHTLTESLYLRPPTPGRLSTRAAGAGVLTTLALGGSVVSAPGTPRRGSDARPPLTPRTSGPPGRGSVVAMTASTPVSVLDASALDLPMSPTLGDPRLSLTLTPAAGATSDHRTETPLQVVAVGNSDGGSASAELMSPPPPAIASSTAPPAATMAVASAPATPRALVSAITTPRTVAAPLLPFSPPAEPAATLLPFSPPAASTGAAFATAADESSSAAAVQMLSPPPPRLPDSSSSSSTPPGAQKVGGSPPAVPPAVVAATEAAREASRVVARITGTVSRSFGLSAHTAYVIVTEAPSAARATAAGRVVAAAETSHAGGALAPLYRRYTAFCSLFATARTSLDADASPAAKRWRRVLADFPFPGKILLASWRRDVLHDRTIKLTAALELITQAATEVAAVDELLATFLTPP